jgi:hypothetical protein
VRASQKILPSPMLLIIRSALYQVCSDATMMVGVHILGQERGGEKEHQFMRVGRLIIGHRVPEKQ